MGPSWSPEQEDDVTKRPIARVLRRRLPSPAMVVACLALTVALAGTSYAAIRLPANSVGTAQLKSGAVTGAKVQRNTLGGDQIAESRLGKVPEAANAHLADIADQARSARISQIDYRQSGGTIPTSRHARIGAFCDAPAVPVAGGAGVTDPDNAFVTSSTPIPPVGWEATARAGAPGIILTVWVICARAANTTR
jgi:hypothetical protein